MVDVHGLAKHMLGMFGHRARTAAQHGVGFGGAIGGNDDNGVVRTRIASGGAIGFPQGVEQPGVHVGRPVGAPVAQKPVQLFQHLPIIVAAGAEGRGDRFLAVRMVEEERAGVAIGHGGFERVGRKRGEHRAGEGEKPGPFAASAFANAHSAEMEGWASQQDPTRSPCGGWASRAERPMKSVTKFMRGRFPCLNGAISLQHLSRESHSLTKVGEGPRFFVAKADAGE